MAHRADLLANIGSRGKFTENGYRPFDLVVSLEFPEGLCLFTKNGGDGLDGVTVLELLGEGVLSQR